MIKLLPLIVLLASCSQTYNRYSVIQVPYQQSKVVAADAATAVEVLVSLGYEIDKVNRDEVTTKWERYYQHIHEWLNEEYQIRIVLELDKGLIKGQCTQRQIRPPMKSRPDNTNWVFHPCDNPIMYRRLEQAVRELQRRLPVYAGVENGRTVPRSRTKASTKTE